MEEFKIAADMKMIMVQATSFPDKITEAFLTLEKLDSTIPGRPFYGISWLGAGEEIIYNAATPEKYDGEAAALGCKDFTIQKGNYACKTVADFMKNPTQIGQAFEKLLALPEVNKAYPCIEYYKSPNEVICMVHLLDQN